MAGNKLAIVVQVVALGQIAIVGDHQLVGNHLLSAICVGSNKEVAPILRRASFVCDGALIVVNLN